MSKDTGKWAFRVITIALPFCVPVLIELQRQLGGRQLDWWTLSSLATGVIASTIAAGYHVQRAGTEQAQKQAEVVTNRDADDDQLVEQPEGGP